jgi:hypothetical protein
MFLPYHFEGKKIIGNFLTKPRGGLEQTRCRVGFCGKQSFVLDFLVLFHQGKRTTHSIENKYFIN